MISTPTVFVLGAGASVPFGFPTGDGLRREIIKSALSENPLRDKIFPDTKPLKGFSESVIQAAGGAVSDRVQLESFADSLLDSGLSSVDAFLEVRPEFRDIGRLSIASALIRREAPEVVSLHEGDWILYLWNQMRGAVTDGGVNNVGFITFNYDRTLEFRLTLAIAATLHLDTAKAWEIVQQWPIVHIYGQLAPFKPVGDEQHREYRADLSEESLNLAASSLRFIDERDDAPLEEARSLLSQAHHVVFLGFGFDRTNVRRLANRNSKVNRLGFRLMASSLGMTDGEVRLATERVISAFEVKSTTSNAGQTGYETPRRDSIKFWNGSCMDTLREFADTISDV